MKNIQRKLSLSNLLNKTKNLFFDSENNMELIGLFDLPKEKIRIKLTSKYREKMFLSLLTKHKSFSGIAKKYSIKKRETARRYFLGIRGIPLDILIKISADLKIQEKEIQKHVIEIKTLKSKQKITNPKLPFKIYTKEFGLIVGGILGDGGIEKNKKRVWYFNNEKEQIESFILAVEKSFGKVDFSFHRSISGTPCVIFPKILGIILEKVGLESGNKNYAVHLGVPKFIMKAKNKEIQIELLKRLFDDDGNVCNNYNHRSISLIAPKIHEEKIVEPQVLLDVQKILKGFGIKSNIVISGQNVKENGEKTINWLLKITGKENLNKYAKKVGFGLKRKEETLKMVLERYVEGLDFYPRNKAREEYLKRIANLTSKNISITAKSLSKACKRNDRHIREVLLQLFLEGNLERNKTGNKFVYCFGKEVN